MKHVGKRAQASGAMAGVLVLLITFLIVLYLLFLPKGERDRIIGSPTTTAGTAASQSGLPGSVLLRENPGILTKPTENDFEHRLPSFNLFTKKEDAVLKSVDSVYVESSRGTDKRKAVMLGVNDKVENAKLSFTVSRHSGSLIISQNEREIFQGEVESFAEPLSLTLEKENLFEFSTEPVPWWKPFSKNFYDIRELKVTATVERLDNKEALQTVLVSQEEANLMSEASLSFFVDCNVRDVGRLIIYLNGGLLASKVPDCGSPERLQIDPEDLISGKNEFRFVAEKGTYLLDRLVLRTKLKEPIFPLYFFSINSSVFRKIENNTINSTLSIRFVDDKERKTSTLDINNQKVRMDTRQANFSRNIDSFLAEGTNFIRIVPDTTLSILELEVLLDCKTAADCS